MLTAELVDAATIDPLILHWSDMTAEQDEADVDVSNAWDRTILDRSPPFYLKGTRITYTVPFAGEADLFKTRPSTCTLNSPEGTVRGGELRFQLTAVDPDPGQVKLGLDRNAEQIRKYVDWINAEVAAFNLGLAATARRLVEARHAKVLRDQALVASLGVPLRRREMEPTFAAPSVRRKARTTVAAPAATRRPTAPEPVLVADDYEFILEVVLNMVAVMERSPHAFKDLDEEGIRTHFLVQLNGHFEGRATAETFNFQGKTDILVPQDGRHVFVAECKFWRGPKQLAATVDQLLRYTSWRDTKTAIFLFNRTKNLSSVLEKVPEVIRGHPAFVREIDYDGETAFRFVLRHPDDASRELTLSILVFEVPSADPSPGVSSDEDVEQA